VPYYARVSGDRALLNGHRMILDAIDVLRAAREFRRAQALEVAYLEFNRALDRQAKDSARFATAAIRQLLAVTVRPSTPGPHLADAIISEPISQALASGAFGIGRLDVLNAHENPRTGGAYWLVQEIGTGASDPVTGISIPSQVGRPKVVPGYFMPGYRRPAAAEFRAHPYFQQMTYAKGMPAMQIKREIEGKHFMRDGSRQALSHHLQRTAQIQGVALSAMRRAVAI
jgi:hypothetical protein